MMMMNILIDHSQAWKNIIKTRKCQLRLGNGRHEGLLSLLSCQSEPSHSTLCFSFVCRLHILWLSKMLATLPGPNANLLCYKTMQVMYGFMTNAFITDLTTCLESGYCQCTPLRLPVTGTCAQYKRQQTPRFNSFKCTVPLAQYSCFPCATITLPSHCRYWGWKRDHLSTAPLMPFVQWHNSESKLVSALLYDGTATVRIRSNIFAEFKKYM